MNRKHLGFGILCGALLGLGVYRLLWQSPQAIPRAELAAKTPIHLDQTPRTLRAREAGVEAASGLKAGDLGSPRSTLNARDLR